MQPSLGAPLPAASRCIARPFAILAAFGLLALVGCEKPEEIEHYRVTRPEPAKAGPDESGPDKERILGAIIQEGDQSWFLKFMGPAEVLAKYEAAFDQLLKSVRLTKDAEQPLTWTLPEGWQEKKAGGFRYATLLPDPSNPKLEVSVSRAGGSLYDNVKRWSEQVRPKAISPDEMSKVTREVKGENVTITRVDVAGPGGKAPKMPPFAGTR
jgi:hypothetical protein